jgi:hypothetical protein
MPWRGAQDPVAARVVVAEGGAAAGLAESLALALAAARWEQVAGAPVAAHTAVVSAAGGTLTVGVPNAAWRSRLERQRPHLLAALQGSGTMAADRVSRLECVVVAPDELTRLRARFGGGEAGAPTPARRPARRGAAPPPEPPPLAAEDARALTALSGEADAELRGVFESWMRHVRRRRRTGA